MRIDRDMTVKIEVATAARFVMPVALAATKTTKTP
jgi:hypothetical protein